MTLIFFSSRRCCGVNFWNKNWNDRKLCDAFFGADHRDFWNWRNEEREVGSGLFFDQSSAFRKSCCFAAVVTRCNFKQIQVFVLVNSFILLLCRHFSQLVEFFKLSFNHECMQFTNNKQTLGILRTTTNAQKSTRNRKKVTVNHKRNGKSH